jgi:hypothetical protein
MRSEMKMQAHTLVYAYRYYCSNYIHEIYSMFDTSTSVDMHVFLYSYTHARLDLPLFFSFFSF